MISILVPFTFVGGPLDGHTLILDIMQDIHLLAFVGFTYRVDYRERRLVKWEIGALIAKKVFSRDANGS